MACIVHVILYKIDVNYIQTSELWSYNQTKTLVNFVKGSDFNILLQEVEFSCFFYCIHNPKHESLTDHDMFNEYNRAHCYQLILYWD